MPRIKPPEIKQIEPEVIEPKLEVLPTEKVDNTEELKYKRRKLENYLDRIWKGEYSPKSSVEVIWRLFNEPKK